MSACIIPSCRTKCLSGKERNKKARFQAGFHYGFNAYSTATMASHSGAMLSGVIPATLTRPEATAYTPNSSRRRSTCSLVRPLKENMPFCLMIKLKSRFAPFSCKRIDEQHDAYAEYAGAYQSALVPRSHAAHRCSGWWQQQKRRVLAG